MTELACIERKMGSWLADLPYRTGRKDHADACVMQMLV